VTKKGEVIAGVRKQKSTEAGLKGAQDEVKLSQVDEIEGI